MSHAFTFGLGLLAGLLLLILAIQVFLKQVGRKALKRIATEIRLVRADGYAFSRPDQVGAHLQILVKHGFTEAGTYAVEGIDGLAIQFLIRANPTYYAVIYDFPKKNMLWVNVVLLFTDGSSLTLTDMPNRGIEERPHHPIMHLPGESFEVLLAKAQESLQGRELRRIFAADLVPEFERAYREGIAWKKQQGISVKEVRNVIKTRRN